MRKMPQIEISAELYAYAKEQARLSGFDSADAFVAHEISVRAEMDAIESKFTPTVLAEFDRIVAERDAGGPGFTLEEVVKSVKDAQAERRAS